MKKPNKYFLYELSVQSPETHAELLDSMYKDSFGKRAESLREDFCGTFAISCEWVKKNPKATALGVDLDPEPLAYGRKRHLARLSREQKSRVSILKANVLSVEKPKVDLVMVGNFSFFIFKERRVLLDYFKSVHRSLKPNGMLILEVMGGPGSIEITKERKSVRMDETGKKKERFTYIWDQKSFNPITRNGLYAIHFQLPDGTRMNDSFTYDWRLWTLPEIRDVLADAGFDDTSVYWEIEHKGEGTGEYARMEKADNDYAWIAYACGIKKTKKA